MKKQKKFDLLRAFTLLFVCAGIIFFYLNLLSPSKLPPLLHFGVLNKPCNILILGTDLYINAETRKAKPGRTDSMMFLHYNPQKQKFYSVSIPRDSYVSVPGYGMQKINSAFVFGGIPLVKEALENVLSRKIDYYIIINPDLLVKIVDLVGGIDLYVDKDMHYTDTAQNLKIDLKEGYHHLSGKQAGQFIRYRMDPMGDLTRVGRQQVFLKALFKKIARPSQLAKAPFILKLLGQNIQTNMSQKEIVLLLNSVRMLSWDDIETFMLPGTTRDEEPGNYFIDKAEIDRFMDKYF